MSHAPGLALGDVAACLINRNPVTGRATKKFVDRLPGMLACDVPQGVVDGAERHGEDAPPSIQDPGGVHLVPQLFDVERVGAHEQMLQVPVDDFDRHAAPGAHPEPGQALVGLDDGNDGRGELLEWPAEAPASRVVVTREGRSVE